MPPSLAPGSRWHALDVFRGLVVLGMILVNAADLSGRAYPWLQHAHWDGCNFADTVFPGFLFIMGVAMGISLYGHVRGGLPLSRIYPRIVRRTLVLFGLGLILNGFSAHGLSDLRVMGVLQRLALCYFLAAIILLHLSQRAQLFVAGGLLLGYWAALALIKVPQDSESGSIISDNLPAYIDRLLLGTDHLLRADPYVARMDPEGVLGTLPAVVNVLFGAFAGSLLARAATATKTTLQLGVFGSAGCLLGLAFSLVFPINKSLWTSSFVLLTSGLAILGLAGCYELVDVRAMRRFGEPFEALGLNAIAAYLLSTSIDALVVRIHVATAARSESIYEWWLAAMHLGPANGAFVFAVSQALVVWAFARVLQARGWFLKI